METLKIVLWVLGILLGVGAGLALLIAVLSALEQLWEWLKGAGYLLLVIKSPFLIVGWVLTTIWLTVSKIALTVSAWGKGVKIRMETKRNLKRFYLKNRGQFKNWRHFKRWSADEGKAPEHKEQDKYARALEMLDLDKGFTKPEFKTAYRRLSSYMHPDKGCPTDYFAKQINEAVTLVKIRRNWK